MRRKGGGYRPVALALFSFGGFQDGKGDAEDALGLYGAAAPPTSSRWSACSARSGRCYSLYGFTPLDTPAIESAEVLLAKGGGETEKQIYRFMKGDSDLALRFDLTVPLAKYVAANYAKLAFPFRRYQIGKVWRGERAQRGRFREFYQADIDVIGDGKLDIMNEAEIPSIICRAFTELGLEDFTIRINNRKVLGGFFAMHGMNDRRPRYSAP